MCKLFKLIAVLSLVACLALSVGCGRKKNYTADNGSSSSNSSYQLAEETLPNETIGEEKPDGSGETVVETEISIDALDDPVKYNKEQDKLNSSTDKTSSASSSATSSANNSSDKKDEDKEDDKNSSTSSKNESSGSDGYKDNAGWFN